MQRVLLGLGLAFGGVVLSCSGYFSGEQYPSKDDVRSLEGAYRSSGFLSKDKYYHVSIDTTGFTDRLTVIESEWGLYSLSLITTTLCLTPRRVFLAYTTSTILPTQTPRLYSSPVLRSTTSSGQTVLMARQWSFSGYVHFVPDDRWSTLSSPYALDLEQWNDATLELRRISYPLTSENDFCLPVLLDNLP